MDEVLLVMAALLAAVGFWILRIDLVTTIRLRALSMIWQRDDFVVLSVRFVDGPSHSDMMSDLGKWKFEQFYPWLVEGV